MDNISELKTRFGIIRAFKNDLITNQIIQYGNHTRPEFAFATCFVSPGHKIFDLGAHIGTFSLTALSKIGPYGSILSVEGNLETFEVLTHNLSKYDNCNLLHTFIGQSGNYEYKSNSRNTGSGHLIAGGDDLNMLSIDQLVEMYFEPNYVKIDIEGFEQISIIGSSYIKFQKPAIYFELNQRALLRNGGSSNKLLSYLDNLGYLFFQNIGERNATHDLFVVKNLKFWWDLDVKVCDILCIHRDSEFSKILLNYCISHQTVDGNSSTV